MRFIDDNIKLIINDLHFKAYLDDSDVNHVTKDQQLPFAPLSFTNDSMATRVNETAKFTFNVFSETRGECIQNFNNLLSLIKSIKPTYYIIDDQYVPASSNVTGFVDLFFSGMPSRENIKLHLTNFNYSFNKDLGYLEVPRSEIKDFTNSSFYESQNMKLIPLAYKISMEGKILLTFDKTANVIGRRLEGSNTSAWQVMTKSAGSTDPEYINMFYGIYSGLTSGKNLLSLNDKQLAQVITKMKQLKDKYLVDLNGKFIEENYVNEQYNASMQPLTESVTESQEASLAERRKQFNKYADDIIKISGQ